MTTETGAIPTPVCDGCGEEFSAMSLMNFADYSQVRIGLACAPDFLRTIADSMDGRHTAAPAAAEPDAEPDPYEQSAGSEPNTEPPPNEPNEWAGQVAAIPAGPDGDPDWQEAPDTGSKSDHWASTTNVRRSTHGHRTPRGATGKPREDTPE